MYTGKEGEVNSRILYPNELGKKKGKKEEEEGDSQLPTHPTRRSSRFDIRRDSQSLEFLMAGNLWELAKIQTWAGSYNKDSDNNRSRPGEDNIEHTTAVPKATRSAHVPTG